MLEDANDGDGLSFQAGGRRYSTDDILRHARKYTQEQRDKVESLWLSGNIMDTLPKELCMMFPNVRTIAVAENRLSTINVHFMTNLKVLYVHNNQLQRFPSAMTRLTKLETLCTGGNTSLHEALRFSSFNFHEVQELLRTIHAHNTPIDAACRSTIIALLGVRKFRPIPTLAMIDKNVMAIIGKMMQADCVSGAWKK